MKKLVFLFILSAISFFGYAQIDSISVYSETNDSIEFSVFISSHDNWNCYYFDSTIYTPYTDSIVVDIYKSEYCADCKCGSCPSICNVRIAKNRYKEIDFNLIVRDKINDECEFGEYHLLSDKTIDLSAIDPIYDAIIDSLNNQLIGEWEWYGSGGGLAWTGFGGPEENGYTVKIAIEHDLYSDSLLFQNYVNDTLVNQGKTMLDYWERDSSRYGIKSILPKIQESMVIINRPGAPNYPNGMLNIEFLNSDTIRLYTTLIKDMYEVYYERMDDTNIIQLKKAEMEIRFYPNPAKNEITIENPHNYEIRKIEMIDLSGRIVHSWTKFHEQINVLHFESLLPGMYLLKIETGVGIKTEKIIIQQN